MELIERYQRMVEEVCKEHDCLNAKQQKALGILLCEYKTIRTEAYNAVIDFLLNADEIDLSTAFDLRDLM